MASVTDPIDRHPELTDALTAHAELVDAHWSGRSHETGCVRCGAQRPDGSDFCAACRAFLLEDTDVDPLAATAPAWSPFDGRGLAELLEAGRVHVWAEDGRTLSGPEAVEHVARLTGAQVGS